MRRNDGKSQTSVSCGYSYGNVVCRSTRTDFRVASVTATTRQNENDNRNLELNFDRGALNNRVQQQDGGLSTPRPDSLCSIVFNPFDSSPFGIPHSSLRYKLTEYGSYTVQSFRSLCECVEGNGKARLSVKATDPFSVETNVE